jgi:protein SCO1/2/putative membrane protein
MGVQDLPAVNASLNSCAAVLLVWGYTLIRRKRINAHRRVMIAAFSVSVAFLISYLVYHYEVGSVRFQKTGMVRTVYLTILLTHTVLAAAVPFLAGITLYRGLRGDYGRHRRIARWSLPIWLYVSVSGVVVYWMLYQM